MTEVGIVVAQGAGYALAAALALGVVAGVVGGALWALQRAAASKVRVSAEPGNLSFNHGRDTVARLVHDMTAAELVEWLVEHHGLTESSRSTVESNMREQFKWHRLQGRLDRGGFAAAVAELLRLRSDTRLLERPAEGSR